MESFQIKYSEGRNLTIIIITLMLVIAALVGVMLFVFLKMEIEGDIGAIIFGVILTLCSILLGVALIVMFKVKGVVSFSENLIEINLNKSTLLYKNTNIKIPFSNIKNAVLENDTYNRKVISLSIVAPSKTIYLAPISNDENDNFDQFWNSLDALIQKYNQSQKNIGQQIQHKSMYEQWWAKLLAIICAVLAIGICITKIVDQDAISTWRLIAFLAYTIPFCFIVYQANKKKK
ncbi:MAG: hypothetical protein U0T07_06170 [Chitinophagales bacterium]